MMRPCLKCGVPTETSYCPEHQPAPAPKKNKLSREALGYGGPWRRLSLRARKMQPFCSDCGTPEDLTCDHSPEAWRRHDAGLPIRLQDVDVVCRRCNSKRGAARGENPTWGGRGRPNRGPVPGGSRRPDHTPRGVCVMYAGPKRAADESALPWRPRSRGAQQFGQFCRKFIVTPKGAGARKPMILRPWQVGLVGSLLGEPRPRLALWSLPRGQGKSTLVAALALHHVFFSKIEGARVVIVAQDERSSLRLLATATRMVALNEDLAARVQVYKDKLVIPGSDSQILALPGEAARIEGEDASLAVMDEVGFCRRDAYESLINSTGKRAGSQALLIGTPSPPSWRETSPMLDLVLDARANPQPDFRLVEYRGDISHPVDCEHCWELANPGLDDLVSREHLRTALPPRTRESEFRRARLGQWVEQDDSSLLPLGLWEALNTGEVIPEGAEVVLSLDGSFNGDSTALLVTTVATSPHYQVGGLWEPPAGNESYRVPVLEVEDRIRELARTYRVLEVTADPYRWARTLQVLEAEGIPVTEFPQTVQRMTPATSDFVQACLNNEVSHDGDPNLARHVANAVVTDDARGVRLRKENKSSARHIDLAVTAVMGHSRATWRATRKPKRRRVVGFKN